MGMFASKRRVTRDLLYDTILPDSTTVDVAGALPHFRISPRQHNITAAFIGSRRECVARRGFMENCVEQALHQTFQQSTRLCISQWSQCGLDDLEAVRS